MRSIGLYVVDTTRLSDNLLKLENHTGLKNWADELWKLATANV